ncbi:MAG: hypothetical protein WD423_12085 [Rhodothermales bacterium]
MSQKRASDETVIVARYMSRHDAEMAKSFLEDQGIASFVAADDTHVPLQLTEGARLMVMGDTAATAREALADAEMLPAGGEEDPAGEATSSRSFYLAVFALLLVLIVLTYLRYGL